MNIKRNVLIIDDDCLAEKGVLEGLENMGYHVTVCASGEDAQRYQGNGKFDFIIIDNEMSGRKGTEATRAMRQRHPRAFIIGVSGADMCDAFLFAGANWFIHKPVTPLKLKRIFRDLSMR